MEQKRNPSQEDVQLSRLLSSILRHRAEKLRLPVRPDGYILLNHVLQLPEMKKKHVTQEQIQRVVDGDLKQRYSLSQEKDSLWIRANQGHSIQAVESDQLLTLVKDPNDYPHCIHGTSYDAWKHISKNGLNKMKRRHIHFCSKPFQSDEIISGMRTTSEVLIHIDLQKAMKDGILFYVSDNQVLLSEGVDGTIRPEYFACVMDKTGKPI